MSKLLNLELMRSPYNWIIVTIILLFGLFLIALISPQE